MVASVGSSSGSGYDIPTVVDALVTAQGAPKKQQLDRLEKATTTQVSGLGSLKSALSDFQGAVKNLNKASLFQSKTASSSSSAVGLTATSTPPVGKYSVQVQQLASSSKVALQSVAGGNAATFGSGTLKISAGSKSIDIDVTAANNSLAGIRDAINAKGESFSASIVSDASGSRLILNSTNSGDNNNISVVATPNGVTSGANSLSVLNFTPVVDASTPTGFAAPNSSVPGGADANAGAGGVITKAQSAKLTVDGLQIVSDSNMVANAIEGVTLNLAAVTDAGKSVDITVGVDKSVAKAAIAKFVDAYNALTNTINTLTSVVQVGEGKAPVTGPLLGDATVRGMASGIRNELVKMTGSGGVQALASLGITSQVGTAGAVDGTLKIDGTKLDTALDKSFSDIGNYFTGTNGLAGRLDKSVNYYMQAGGVLDQRIKGLQATTTNIDKQRADLTDRMTKLSERLTLQWTTMDALVGRLKKTSESLTSQFENLPGLVSKKS